MFTKEQEIKLDRISNVLSDPIERMDVATKVDSNDNYIITSWKLCGEIVQQLKTITNLTNKTVLVVDTVEFVPILLLFGVNKNNITYVAPYEFKGKLATSLGVKVEKESLLNWNGKNEKGEILEFDFVIGNPPYQGKEKNSDKNLWVDYVGSGMKYLKPNGLLAFITPTKWLGKTTSSKKADYSVFYTNRILAVHAFDDATKKSYFSIGSTICWFILQKASPSKTIKIITYKNGSSDSIIDIEINGGRSFPIDINKNSISIHSKIIEKDASGISYNCECHSQKLKKLPLSDKPTKSTPYLTHYSAALKRYSSYKSSNYNSIRIMTSIGSTLSNSWIGKDCNSTEDVKYLTLNSMKEANNALSVFKSKLFFYIGKNYRHGRNQVDVLLALPMIDFKKSWTDNDLYMHLNLTQNEIDYIENF